MEIDTGAAISLTSEKTRKALFPSASLDRPAINLRTFTADPISVVGEMKVNVRYKGYKGSHNLYAMRESGPSLLGRGWLSKICLD